MSGDGNILESECSHELGVLLKQILLQPSPKVKSNLVQIRLFLKPILKKHHKKPKQKPSIHVCLWSFFFPTVFTSCLQLTWLTEMYLPNHMKVYMPTYKLNVWKVECVWKGCQILSFMSILTFEGIGISNLTFPEERVLGVEDFFCWIEGIDHT